MALVATALTLLPISPGIKLLDNIPLMHKFNNNVQTIFSLLSTLPIKMPPFPTPINTIFLGSGAAMGPMGASVLTPMGGAHLPPGVAQPTAPPGLGYSQATGQGQGGGAAAAAAAAEPSPPGVSPIGPGGLLDDDL